MKLDILAVGVHPDDVELGCGGTIIKHLQEGYKVGILDLTRGELGTRGSAAIRDQEAESAAEILGIQVRENVSIADGFFQNDEEHQRKIIRVLRKYQPEIVLANAISDRHPDHGRAGKLTADACFLSGLPRIETNWEGTSQKAWRPKAVYHYIQGYYRKPDFVVDVTDFFEKKMEAVMAYTSQFYNPDSDEPDTFISSKGFLEMVRARAVEYGGPVGVKYAEGFEAGRLIKVNTLFDVQ